MIINGEEVVHQTVHQSRSLLAARGGALVITNHTGAYSSFSSPYVHILIPWFCISAPAYQHTFSYQRGIPVNGTQSTAHTQSYVSSPHGLTTPALSSGPSSNGSSPSSHPYSRAPSPTHPHPIHHSQSYHTHSSPYLAHSVRAAFGMTPIHPATPLPSTYVHVAGGSAGPSAPTSRAGSPPIKLAPLRVPSPSTLGDERGGKSPRMGGVALPGFSEVEAATRAA
jgi:zinc-finger protein CreA/MIG